MTVDTWQRWLAGTGRAVQAVGLRFLHGESSSDYYKTPRGRCAVTEIGPFGRGGRGRSD
jgi:hypothetical protein